MLVQSGYTNAVLRENSLLRSPQIWMSSWILAERALIETPPGRNIAHLLSFEVVIRIIYVRESRVT